MSLSSFIAKFRDIAFSCEERRCNGCPWGYYVGESFKCLKRDTMREAERKLEELEKSSDSEIKSDQSKKGE